MLPLADKRILDVGCGTGEWLSEFERWGARRDRCAGIDLIPDRVSIARSRIAWTEQPDGEPAPGADIRCGNASRLPWDDGVFEIVAQSMVFSSVLDPQMRRSIADEMARVLAPHGVILWYDFVVGNPRNPNLCAVRKPELIELFPGFDVRSARITLVQPLARLLVERAPLAAAALERMRLVNSHRLAALTRSRAHGR
jgi:SAM-dependent methyltransferase